MLDVPFVGIAIADAGKVRSGALRPPLERMVVHRFRRQAVVAVAFDLVAERADHLAVAGVAAFADVDVAPGELERRIGPHPLHLLDRVLQVEERRDLDDAADGDHHERADQQERRVAFDGAMSVKQGHSCDFLILRAGLRERRPSRDEAAHRLFLALVAPDCHEHVPGHDQHPGQVHQPADRADDVVGVHGGDGFCERIDQEALLVVFAPHQALLDAGHPHHRRVDDDAERGEPEVPGHHAQRIEPFTIPQFRRQVIDRAEDDQAVPAERARMNVADRPVRVVAERIDRLDRHQRAFEGRHAVESDGHHHHAHDRIGADLVPGARQRHQPVDHAAPGGHPQHDREHHAQRLRPVGHRGEVQVMRAGPDVEEDDRPEMDDRQAIAVDWAIDLLGDEIIHHGEEGHGQEEGDRVVAVPPLRDCVLDAGKSRIAL